MTKMARRERLMAIFQGQIPDRPAVKVWGVGTKEDGCVHPAFERVRDLAVDRTDLVRGVESRFSIYCGQENDQLVEEYEEPSDSPDWVDRTTIYHTPNGKLREVYRQSTCNKPGYLKEYLLKEPDDIKKLLSLPYKPYPFSSDEYRRVDAELGDAGIVKFQLDHTMYALQRIIGSENFALWSVDAEDLLLEAMETFAIRLRDHIVAAVGAGICGVFSWAGPELCIPPLMSPAAFEKYVFAMDKPLIDLIHEAGGYVWVHCHGKMKPVLRRFMDMGVDVLNPIEPPPMGDLTMSEAFDVVGDRMGLEGNIETHDFMVASNEELLKKIHETLEAGRGRRLILCPSSGYMENVNPSLREITNWLLYVNEAVRYAEAMSAG